MTVEQHREKTIQLYRSFLSDTDNLTEFQGLLFTRAIFRLNAGHKPKKVEDWVVKMERCWMYYK